MNKLLFVRPVALLLKLKNLGVVVVGVVVGVVVVAVIIVEV